VLQSLLVMYSYCTVFSEGVCYVNPFLIHFLYNKRARSIKKLCALQF